VTPIRSFLQPSALPPDAIDIFRILYMRERKGRVFEIRRESYSNSTSEGNQSPTEILKTDEAPLLYLMAGLGLDGLH
jgi:hypothetical protein